MFSATMKKIKSMVLALLIGACQAKNNGPDASPPQDPLLPLTPLSGDFGVGASIVQCTEGASVTSQALDIYEMTMLGMTLDLGAATVDPIAKVHLALDRLKMMDPIRGE